MLMTDSEIVREFKEAKNKRKQLDILAAENNCKVADIRSLLEVLGVDVAQEIAARAQIKKRGRPSKAVSELKELTEKVVNDQPKDPCKDNEIIRTAIDLLDQRIELLQKKKGLLEEALRLE